MAGQAILERIAEAIDQIEIVDTHEHLLTPEEARRAPVDLFTMLRTGFYIQSDLVSSGLPLEELTPAAAERADPEKVCAHLAAIANTSYYRSYLAAFRALFDYEGELITPADWQALSTALETANQRPDWYEYVLKEKAHIKTCLWDKVSPTVPVDTDRRYFAPVVRFDLFVAGHKQAARQRVESIFGRQAETLEEYLELLDLAFDRVIADGALGIKSGLAYARALDFQPVSRTVAARLFTKSTSLLRRGFRETSITDLSPAEARQFQDYIMFQVARRAGELGLPLQIHTGMHGGNGNLLANANPLHLSELILRTPGTHFVLMHGGYPFTRELGILAKNFTHVYVDACWLAQINQADYQDALSSWLELVPANKILAWGGDCARPEASFGSLLLAKSALAKVLAAKVAADCYSWNSAVSLARRLLHDNAAELYGI